MIDEITEVGNYTFQIRLLDESRNSRATIPEVVNGIEIREPIACEDVSTTNEVGVATVGYVLTTAGTTEDAFDAQGNYNKTTWATGDRITDAVLNKMEAGIDGVNKKVANNSSQIKDIEDEIKNIITTGLTIEQITALDNMFKVCTYTKDVSTEYSAFKIAFGIEGDSGGGETPPEKTKYTITNNLTKVTTSNIATEIEEGSVYRANLTIDVSCVIESVVITMGGVDITSSCFVDNAITINEVTGDIVITAVAKLSKVTAEDLGFTTLYEYDDIYNLDNAIASIGEDGIVDYGYNDAVTVASYYYTIDNLSAAPDLTTFDGRRFGNISYNNSGEALQLKDALKKSYQYKGAENPKCYGCYVTGTNSGKINIFSTQWQNITQTTDVDVHVRILIIQGTDITAEQLCTIFGI